MSSPTLIKPAEYLAKLTSPHGLGIHESFIVTDDFSINGGKKNPINSLCFRNTTFNGWLHIENEPDCRIGFEKCNLLGGLHVSGCEGSAFHMSDCAEVRYIDMYRNRWKRLSIEQVKIKAHLDLSGTEVSEVLKLRSVQAEGLVLYNGRVDLPFSAARVVLDDPVFALQFELARIPVMASTNLVRSMLSGLIGVEA
ncbi:MAG: hypothetical protein WCG97_00400 [bacterium]